MRSSYLYWPIPIALHIHFFERDKYWMWEIAFFQIVWGRGKLISHVIRRRVIFDFINFLAIFSLIYLTLGILVYRGGGRECLNRANIWYLPLKIFSYICWTWWYLYFYQEIWLNLLSVGGCYFRNLQIYFSSFNM